MDAKALEVLSNYNKDLERWKERNAHYKDIQPLSIQDLLFIRTILHPTNKQKSKEVTKKLITFIVDRGVCTAQEIYDELGYNDKPILKRLKIFQQCGLLRRESKKYYLPTPRMQEIRQKHLDRICQ